MNIYIEGSASPSIAGPTVMTEGPANTLAPLQSDAAKNLKVAINSGLVLPSYDYVGVTQTSPTVETFVFKTGGSGGTTVGTVTITYTDSSHDVLVSVVLT